MDVIDGSLEQEDLLDNDNIDSNEKADLDDIFGGDQELESPRKSKLLKSKSTLALPERSIHDEKSSIFSIRAPNFVKFQNDEFIKDLYDAEEERKQLDAAIAVARWRYQRDSNGDLVKDSTGQPIKESNARLVKWSDGSYQVLIGDQVFVASAHTLDSW